MTAIIDGVHLKPGGMLIISDRGSDKKTEIVTKTCSHCNRVVMLRPDRTRPRHTCKRCMKYVCDLCAGSDCNTIERDVERAYRDLGGQPWLLRHMGTPVDRIFLPDGTERLVLRNDHNMTLTERTRYRRSN